MDMELKSLPLDLIIRNPDQPRQQFSQDELEDLAGTFRVIGVGQPITVRKIGDKYMIISGERRWRAAGLAQMESIPAIIRNDLSSGKRAFFMLTENVQRKDLGPMEMARYICHMKEEEGLTQEEITVALGNRTNRSAVAHYLRLLNLPLPVQQLIDDEKLEFGHGKVLCGVDASHQLEFANMAAHGSWTVRQLEAYVKRSGKTKRASSLSKDVLDALTRMETGVSETIGYPVSIQHSGKKNVGKVSIEYGSLEELDGIMERLGYRPEE